MCTGGGGWFDVGADGGRWVCVTADCGGLLGGVADGGLLGLVADGGLFMVIAGGSRGLFSCVAGGAWMFGVVTRGGRGLPSFTSVDTGHG